MLSTLALLAAAPAMPHISAQNKSVEIAPCVCLTEDSWRPPASMRHL